MLTATPASVAMPTSADIMQSTVVELAVLNRHTSMHHMMTLCSTDGCPVELVELVWWPGANLQQHVLSLPVTSHWHA